MSSNLPNNSDNQEIDLGQVAKKISSLFERFLNFIFLSILFIKRNFIVIILLFIIGVGVGIYLDKKIKTYDHQIIVAPNFGSADYVYARIDLLQSKINEGDTLFLKQIGIKDSKKISKITIEPIVDVYKFVRDNEENFEMIKLFAEDGDIEKIVEQKLTSKNYPYHVISFQTSKLTTEEKTVKPILNYLNKNQHYQEIQKEYLENIDIKMAANDSIIAQIDAIMNQFKTKTSGSHSDKLVYYNENTELNEVIKTKDYLVKELGDMRVDKVVLNKVVKETSVILNDKNTKGVNSKFKFIFPLFLLFSFILFKGFISFYRRQLHKDKA
jgi:hypothetical protein